jgi:hypothetical protein
MIHLNNLFDYCDNSTICEDVIFSIGNDFGNTSHILAVKNSNNYIYTYANEWLYLIKSYYPQQHYYNDFLNFYNHTINNKSNNQYIGEDVISFITSFSRGTVHGYSGIFNIIIEYIKNYEIYKDLKIIVSKNSQKGILDIIEHFCNRNIIDRNKIIYIEKNIIYHIHKITFIPNSYHIINNDLANEVADLVDKDNSLLGR